MFTNQYYLFLVDRLNSVDEEIEFSTISSEVSALSSFVQKTATD